MQITRGPESEPERAPPGGLLGFYAPGKTKHVEESNHSIHSSNHSTARPRSENVVAMAREVDYGLYGEPVAAGWLGSSCSHELLFSSGPRAALWLLLFRLRLKQVEPGQVLTWLPAGNPP